MNITIRIRCHSCGQVFELSVDKQRFEAWEQKKGYIQDLLPELTDDQRELLISETCGSCFDKLFREV